MNLVFTYARSDNRGSGGRINLTLEDQALSPVGALQKDRLSTLEYSAEGQGGEAEAQECEGSRFGHRRDCS